jgi:hypothetical protein
MLLPARPAFSFDNGALEFAIPGEPLSDFSSVFDEDIEISWDDIKETLNSLRADLRAIETYLARLL